jgi:hypothetical protein
VTVCIAARSENTIVGASDRMLTAGDIQFEPSAGTKIFGLSQSLFMMTAGDSAVQAEITQMVHAEVGGRIERENTIILSGINGQTTKYCLRFS